MGPGKAAAIFVPHGWGLLLSQSETAMSGETEAKGDQGESEALGKECWNSLGIIPQRTQIFPILTCLGEDSGRLVSSFTW